ncbi:MFS transporter [Micrococcaceae bacterium Sec5.7]
MDRTGLEGTGSGTGSNRLRRYPRFVRFWLASTVSDFGTYITTLALSVLILVSMEGTPLDQGLVNAARWAPYLLFGPLAGVWVDRFRRRTVLVAGDLGRGIILAGLCLLGATGILTIPLLMVMMFSFGTLALMSDAAYQSFLPQLVPRPLLTRANARLQQSDTVAQTTGSALAGGVVALVSAPFALLIDACSFFFSGLALTTLQRTAAENPPPRSNTTLRQSIGEGLRWVYGHPQLGPLAWSTHIWFIGSATLGAVVPSLILNELKLGALGLGIVLGCAGVGAVFGTTISTRLGERWGTGRTMVAARLVQPFSVVLMALAPVAATSPVAAALNGLTEAAVNTPGGWPAFLWAAFILAALGQFLFGFAMGADSPLEMGYRQAVTPDRLIARMSATMRSVNRGMIVLGAPLGGLIASGVGIGAALWVAAGFMLVGALVLLFSMFTSARIEEQQLTEEQSLAP